MSVILGLQLAEGKDMAHRDATAADVAAIVERCRLANAAFMRGDMKAYLALISHADDYTLMAPFGGAPSRGFDMSGERLEAMARFFRAGKTELEVVQSYTSGDMVVLVAIERQRAEVGGLPEQDWSLRVTLVFHRQGAEWKLAHRHADPLVNEISLEQAAEIARG
ncbi:YybH family protein [Paracraurococcus lichenis]|uniref:Nuclear transport factor 2 family protein n=1 Tax=Paracraurococcus lichenis TaxID=3064888 RepID=A0ABT9EDV1_9PROT|nr:nuclear transport factor 2 family protein [Paracraurococcus sp. LOR1-02]MDO9714060.1 nuclear transport factor 2 family protein [Paracraurococcus sp. LOR1-02]